MAGVALGIGVGAHLDVAARHGVGPAEQRGELGRRLGPRRRQHAAVDPAAAAVDRDLVAGVQHRRTDRDGVAVDVDLGSAHDGRDAPSAGDDRSVTDHAAARREDALRGLHAEHIVGRGLGADEDDVAALVAGVHRVLGGQCDGARCRAG